MCTFCAIPSDIICFKKELFQMKIPFVLATNSFPYQFVGENLHEKETRNMALTTIFVQAHNCFTDYIYSNTSSFAI